MSEIIYPTTLLLTLGDLKLQQCHCLTVQAQVLSHQLLTINVVDQFLSHPYGIYGGQYGNV